MTANPIPRITTYFIVPRASDTRDIQDCDYYNEDGTPARFPLSSCASGTDTNLIRISQPAVEDLPAGIRLSNIAIDASAELYAAVAATVDEDLGLPTLFKASDKRAVVIPVADQTLRGVILIFAIRDSEGRIVKLKPTTDPQIKNGG